MRQLQINNCRLTIDNYCSLNLPPLFCNLMTPDTLEERLLDFGAAICAGLRRMPSDLVGTHLARQLVRSATSPAANCAEARSAESPRDFVHKMRICLKELRETSVWLRLAARAGAGRIGSEPLAKECRELIAIFVTSIHTARSLRASRRRC